MHAKLQDSFSEVRIREHERSSFNSEFGTCDFAESYHCIHCKRSALLAPDICNLSSREVCACVRVFEGEGEIGVGSRLDSILA